MLIRRTRDYSFLVLLVLKNSTAVKNIKLYYCNYKFILLEIFMNKIVI